jgi:hypothetical protein
VKNKKENEREERCGQDLEISLRALRIGSLRQ